MWGIIIKREKDITPKETQIVDWIDRMSWLKVTEKE